MSGFQTSVSVQPAPAVAGDFASANPRSSVLAGPGGLVCGPAGVYVGRFAWAGQGILDADGAAAEVANSGAGAPTGFVHREQQGMITVYLEEASMLVPAGFEITLMNGGDFWVKNDGATQALPGQKVYADLTDGKASAAATGSAATGGSATGSIAASTFSVTGSIDDEILTVTAVGSGTLVAGATISGSGIASGTQIVEQLSGTAGGVGTYSVSIPEQTVASTTVSGTYGTFTAASALTGEFVLGGVLTGTGISVTTRITQFLTGTGGLGTYVVDVNTVVSSTTISQTGNVETKWTVESSALPGELFKMSSIARS